MSSGPAPKLRKNRLSEADLNARHTLDRLGLHDSSQDNIGSHISRRWPSISKRWHHRSATTSVSNPTIHSDPPSRRSSVRQSLAARLAPRRSVTQPASPSGRESLASTALVQEWQMCTKALEIKAPSLQEEPLDRHELASTPLLPPVMDELRGRVEEEVQSPLQSPRIAMRSGPPSPTGMPMSPAAMSESRTPALSTRPSMASLHNQRHGQVPRISSDIPPLSISEETDYWSRRLGHANFHITPEPYTPEVCNGPSCNQLREDWESARAQYLRQAARIREHYGPTSEIYSLTAEKWSEIDYVWRMNFEKANAEAEAHGESPALRSLPETKPVATLPSLNDPKNPLKFPAIDEANIVGPMVQHARVQRTPMKRKATLLRIFTDPVSLLRR